MTSKATLTLAEAAPELLRELQRYVEYYAKDGRSAQLGTGEAFQHWDRARALLARIDT